MNTTRLHPCTQMTVVAAVVALIGVAQVPAAPAPDPGEPLHPGVTADPDNCLLRRVERQFVRCDNLTGAGVPAPLWLPER